MTQPAPSDPRPFESEKPPLFMDHLPPGGWPRGTMLLSWFGLGMINRAPGTLASLGCLPYAAIIVWLGGRYALMAAAVLAFVLGNFFVKLFEHRAGGLDDPQWIVIDEVAAQWATLTVVPLDFVWYVLGFALFRLFDITKPWPVSWADRKPTTFGLMVDDLLAAVYAGAVLWAVRYAWITWVAA